MIGQPPGSRSQRGAGERPAGRLPSRVPAALLALLAAAAAWAVVASASASPPSPARAASYDLGRDERLGGHTLERHVGRSDRELAARLRRERHIAAASSYTDRATAERVVAETLNRSRQRVASWLAREGPRPNLALDYHGVSGRPIGRVLLRGRSLTLPTSDAVVVLKWIGSGDFIVLTSYPEASR